MYTNFTHTINAERLEERGVALLGDLLDRKPDWIGGQISDYDAKFLAGLLQRSGARRIAEIGVASGWGSTVMLQATADVPDVQVSGIDISANFYLDKDKPTGAAVAETLPSLADRFELFAGEFGFDALAKVGSVDFAFIDGHHMHPWATLDLISLIPYLRTESWVAVHDLSLCMHRRHKHTQRGPFYLFYLWPDQKLHSTQTPPMIGAVFMKEHPRTYMKFLLEVLHTPWETHLEDHVINGFLDSIERNFNADWRALFADACAKANRPPPPA